MAMVDFGEGAALKLIEVREQLEKVGAELSEDELVISAGGKRYHFVSEDTVKEEPES
jgi:hypothetical protein